MEHMLAAMRPILVDECERQPFSPAARECFANASGEYAWSQCEDALPQAARDAVQQRLDAIPPPPPSNDAERRQLAIDQAQRIAFDYYALWATRPQHTGCPTSLDAFAPYAPANDTSWKSDPWGTTFTFSCSGTRLIVVSAGPDRKTGTADDISSKD
jgi:hypothetical protein